MKSILTNRWLKSIIILMIEAIILFVMFIHVKHMNKQYQMMIMPGDLFLTEDCSDAIQNEQAITIDRSGSARLEKPVAFFCGPYKELPRGNYQITFYYETDTNDSLFKISTDQTTSLDADYLSNLDGYFQADQTSLTTNIKILKNVKSFEILCKYYGTGIFTLHKIEVVQTGMNYSEVGILATLFVWMNICLLAGKKIRKKIKLEGESYVIALFLLLFFSSILVFVSGLYCGSDTEFHMLRIEGIKEAILSGQLPSRIQPDYVRGYGYASGVMYPDLFLYIPAMLRLVGMDLQVAYKCFIVVVNFLTIIVSYISFKGMFQKKNLALLGTVMYTLAPYRMIDLYYRAAVGEYCALIGLPLIAYGVFLILRNHNNEKIKGEWIPLALGYSIVIESHILSAIFVAFFSGIIFLCCRKKTFTKPCLTSIIQVGIGVLTLNAWFIVPWLDYYRLPLNTFTDTIEKNGLMVAQLFLNQHLSDPGFNRQLADGLLGETPFGIGYAIIVGVALYFFYGIREKNWIGRISCVIGLLAVWFSTYYFPWDTLAKISMLEKVVMNIQFPWRFLMIATIAFIICSCVGVEKSCIHVEKHIILFTMILLSVFGFSTIVDNCIQRVQTENYGMSSLNSFTTGLVNEYMLIGTDVEAIKATGDLVKTSSDEIVLQNISKSGTTFHMEIISNSGKEECVEVPLLLYPGYVAKSEQGKSNLHIDYGENNRLRVFIPAGFQDQVQISFEEKWYWRVSELMSLLITVYIIECTYRRKKENERLASQ